MEPHIPTPLIDKAHVVPVGNFFTRGIRALLIEHRVPYVSGNQ